MKTLALVPARAGSKGIPHKNTREFNGLPLLAHAIKVGQATCDRTVVSTEDMETACLAASYGAIVQMRPMELAQDDTPMLPVIQHALANVADKPDVIVLLQPSSPSARREVYVRAALQLLRDTGADSVVSVCRIPPHLTPHYAVKIGSDGQLYAYDGNHLENGLTRRQDAKPAYYRDGSVYAIGVETLSRGQLYGWYCEPLVIPAEDSATIDTEEDWALAEARHA